MKKRNDFSRVLAASASLSAVMLFGGIAAAAEEEAGLEEVVVSAQKRTENIQEVPASVSVIGGEALERLHANQIADYAAYLPGFNVSNNGSPGQTTVTLRGIAPVGPGAVVGTYINDTPLGSSSNYARSIEFALDLMPYDVERVEVLRGPQGTLYGAGSMGGLLKYVLKEADPSRFEARAGVEGSSVNHASDLGWGARGAVNLPIGETTAVRLSAFKQDTPGFIDNSYYDSKNENKVEQYGGRAAFLWQASDALSVKLGGMWQRIRSDDKTWQTLSLTGIDPPTGNVQLGELTGNHALPQPFSKDVDFYSATINWDAGFADFTSASSYSKAHTRQKTDATFVYGILYPFVTDPADPVPPGLNDFTLTLDLKKWTQEFRLASKSGGRLEWLLGAFYTDEKSGNVQQSVAADFDGNAIPVFDPFFVFAELPTHYREYSGFGDVTLKIMEQFDITAGIRWAKNKQAFRQISGGAILPVADVPGHSNEDVWTYAVSPRYHITQDTMAYLRVASGYRPGGPNVFLPDVPPQVDADKLTNYELGLKSEFLNRRAYVDVDYFRIDWKGIQQIQAFGGISALSNAGDARTNGFEFDSNFLAMEHLRLGVNFAYTRAKLLSNPEGINNTIGAQLPLVPKWSGALTADYSFHLAGHEARVGGGYRYSGKRESTVVTDTDNLSYVLPSYKLLDLNAEMNFEHSTLRVFAKNVTDKRAYTGGGVDVNGFNQPYQIDVSVQQPRTFGVSMDFKF